MFQRASETGAVHDPRSSSIRECGSSIASALTGDCTSNRRRFRIVAPIVNLPEFSPLATFEGHRAVHMGFRRDETSRF